MIREFIKSKLIFRRTKKDPASVAVDAAVAALKKHDYKGLIASAHQLAELSGRKGFLTDIEILEVGNVLGTKSEYRPEANAAYQLVLGCDYPEDKNTRDAMMALVSGQKLPKLLNTLRSSFMANGATNEAVLNVAIDLAAKALATNNEDNLTSVAVQTAKWLNTDFALSKQILLFANILETRPDQIPQASAAYAYAAKNAITSEEKHEAISGILRNAHQLPLQERIYVYQQAAASAPNGSALEEKAGNLFLDNLALLPQRERSNAYFAACDVIGHFLYQNELLLAGGGKRKTVNSDLNLQALSNG